MSLKNIDLTTALRPSLLPDEVLLFVQDNVGLYEGYVVLDHQPVTFGSEVDTITANSRFPIIKMGTHT